MRPDGKGPECLREWRCWRRCFSGCGKWCRSGFSLAEPAWTEEQTSPAEPARTEAQTSPAEDARTGGILEAAAGNWRLAGTKTEDHLKEFGDLQEMFGTGIHEGSQMTIGADGSFSFYLGIALGGEGTVREEDGILVADITPYEPEGRGGSPASFAVIPVTEDGSWYLTTETMGETMYWERLPGTDGAEPGAGWTGGGEGCYRVRCQSAGVLWKNPLGRIQSGAPSRWEAAGLQRRGGNAEK